MTATTDNTGYQSTKALESAPEAVFDALTSADAIASWWAPATGSGAAGGEITLLFGGQAVRIRVDETDRPARVCWTVLVSDPLPDWASTTITFDIAPAADGGTVLHFTHHGLTPQLECFSMCSAGWTQYLASLVDYVDRDGGNAFGSATDERAAAWREHQAGSAS
ncbi:MAG: SRPBCC family protein [Streptosporangiaceae bacterium]